MTKTLIFQLEPSRIVKQLLQYTTRMPARAARRVLPIVCLVVAMHARAQMGPETQPAFAAHRQKAQGYLRDHRPDLAIPELQTAVELNPDNVETQANLGVLLFFQGRPRDAVPHLRAAVERQPSLAKIQGVLGLAELRSGAPSQGRKDLEFAFPQIEEPKFKTECGLELVGLYTQSGDLDLAPGILTTLKKVAPDDAEVQYAAYRTYSDLAAESMLALALAAPNGAQMHQMLAHEENKEGNNQGAIAQYRQAIAINPHQPGIHFELAEALRNSQDLVSKATAEQEYRAALADNPQDEKAIVKLADIDAEKGNTGEAVRGYRRALVLLAADSDARVGLAKALTDLNQPAEAMAELEEVVKVDPANTVAHYRLSALYRRMGRPEDAQQEVKLYKSYKEMKDKLRAQYKDLLIQPEKLRAADVVEK